MATHILSPDNQIGGVADWLLTQGYTWVGAVSDQTDASYVYNPRGGSTAYIGYAFANLPALPAGVQIRSVTPRIRASGDESSSRMLFTLWEHTRGVITTSDEVGFGTAFTTVTGFARTRDYDGAAWTSAVVNNTGVLVSRRKTEDAELRVSKLELIVITNERPAVVATGPVDEDSATAGNQVTTTSTPTVSWTYSDPENDAQERFQVKVFSAAQYGAAGFDPDASAATWDSGVVYSSATSAQVGAILANNTTYRAYVKASDVGSDGRPSLWSFFEFTMALPAPPIPVFAVPVADVTNQEVDLSASSTGTTPAPEFLRFEYRLADGVTWVPVRGYARVPTTSGATQTVSDREAPPNQSRVYRVLAGRTVDGLDLLSSPSTLRSSPNLTNDRWRLKDVIAGTSIALRTADDEADLVEGEPHGVFSPLGAARRVVISDTLKGESIALSLTFMSGAEWDAFRAMRASGNTLLLVSPMQRQWYVRFVGDLSAVLLNFRGTERRRAQAQWVEVDRP